MTAVHQLLPSFAANDAVSAHVLEVQRLLRELGFASEVYAGTASGPRRAAVQPVARYRGGLDGWLLYQLSTGSPLADVAAERPSRTIVNYHNITPPSFFDAWAPAVAAELALGKRQLAALAPVVAGIAVSSYNERELQRAGYRATAVAPVLVDLEGLRSASDEAVEDRLRAAKADGGSDWLFVGRLSPNKAQHDLIKALAVYRRIYDDRARLHLVGSSSAESYSSALRDYADALGLADAVFLHRGVPAATLAAHYRSADVFVCLSEHEGFCVPLLEAMHHELPIVALAAAAVPETLGDAGLLLPGKTPGLVAAAVHRVVSDATVRTGLIERGRARLDHFTLERSRAAFRDALLPLLEGGGQ